ncbi:YtxH domain-containing protein [Leeuwenhoekiella sp. A16]|uniref:YtxH domain-containing protein n=1 Tax=unclassified Leeuwenhoekiella TaxID=2615029 RepID=UPI003A80DEE1|tara:strand:+ start:79009 stop:79386 length:378 start_codon:yes stop_codon:yes gene_type:complete
MSKTGNTILALITGAAIGAGIGLLYAPDSGDKTRKKISKSAKDAQKKLNQQIKETSESLSASAVKAKKTFDEKLEDTLATASEKADDILVTMEKKLEDLRKKNAHLKKEAEAEIQETPKPASKMA